jgi:DNA mismatch endonuclease (patch repair protein)
MPDIYTPEKRSDIMSRIRSSETKPEIAVRKALFSLGYRYRKNVKSLAGKPDIVLRKYKTVIFVNGCFWHRHVGCKYNRMPKSNNRYWSTKFESITKRDEKNKCYLEEQGWQVITVWECEIEDSLSSVIEMIANTLRLDQVKNIR